MISQKAKYALRALVRLQKAGPERSLMIGEISESEAIPKKFLEQILLELKRVGIVDSRRGRHGGYVLLRIDGPIAPLPCLSRIAYRRCADCRNEGSCEIRQVFARVVAAERDVLDHTTLADAVAAGSVTELVA